LEGIKVGVRPLDHFDDDLGFPFYQTAMSSGMDVCACLGKGNSIELKPFETVLIPTGLSFQIPKGYEIQVRPRSGLSLKTGLRIPNSPGTIDADYRGECKVIIQNVSQKTERIEHGLRIAQFVLAAVDQAVLVQFEQLSETQRGEQGFGSTGSFSKASSKDHNVAL
jgi:dUTP pyrophosphatase